MEYMESQMQDLIEAGIWDMENSLPDDWAIKKALKLMAYGGKTLAQVKAEPAELYEVVSFARYIAAHEDAPEDPLYEALKAVVELGRYDTREQTQLLHGELKSRGLEIREIGKAQA